MEKVLIANLGFIRRDIMAKSYVVNNKEVIRILATEPDTIVIWMEYRGEEHLIQGSTPHYICRVSCSKWHPHAEKLRDILEQPQSSVDVLTKPNGEKVPISRVQFSRKYPFDSIDDFEDLIQGICLLGT